MTRLTRTAQYNLMRVIALYVLDKGSTHKIEPIEPQDASVLLVQNSFLIRFPRFLETPSYLLKFAKLINAVPVSRLTLRKSLDALPEVIGMVEVDLART